MDWKKVEDHCCSSASPHLPLLIQSMGSRAVEDSGWNKVRFIDGSALAGCLWKALRKQNMLAKVTRTHHLAMLLVGNG